MIDRERKPSRGSDEYCYECVLTQNNSWYIISIQGRLYYRHKISRNSTRVNCGGRYCYNSHSPTTAKHQTDRKILLARDLSRICYSQNGRGKRKTGRGRGGVKKKKKEERVEHKDTTRGTSKKKTLSIYTQNVRTMSTLMGKNAKNSKARVADNYANNVFR